MGRPLGVLSQGWPANQNEIWKAARRVALATLEKLRAEKRTKEAAEFEASIRAALERDCVINVRWNGDADVNLLVEEPTGSVCSLRNWRTNSGGVLCGDLFAAEAGGASQGHSQIYVCPKGFSGTYKLLVRRVWGQVITGKVSVEVVLHYNTAKAKRICEKIALEKGQAMVKFDLADGRRKEKLQDQQVANAALGQIAVGQQILAQQIGRAGRSAGGCRGGHLREQRLGAGQFGRDRHDAALLRPLLPDGGGGLSAHHHHPAGRGELFGDRRGLRRPTLRPHHQRAVLLRHRQGDDLQLQFGVVHAPSRAAGPAAKATVNSSPAPPVARAPASAAAYNKFVENQLQGAASVLAVKPASPNGAARSLRENGAAPFRFDRLGLSHLDPIGHPEQRLLAGGPDSFAIGVPSGTGGGHAIQRIGTPTLCPCS